MSRHLNTRKKWMVFPAFQWQLVAGLLLVMGTVFGLTFFFVHQSFVGMFDMGLSAGLPADHSFYKFVQYQWSVVAKYLLISMGIGLGATTILAVLLSHKLVGPLVRLRSHFQKMGRTGNAKNIHFRKGDYLEHLGPEINKAITKVQDKKTKRKTTRKKAA